MTVQARAGRACEGELGVSIADVFGKARAENRSVLIGCMPAGFPTVDASIASMKAMAEAGCDVIEVELPYSDPVMDGPVIQKASDIALAGGVRTRDTLRIIEAVAGAGVPVVLMTYWNPIEKYGVNAFARDLAAAGATGMITPDLIPDEAAEWIAASDEHRIDRTFLVSPSSTDERIAMTVAHCRGFVYATALMGVTGARTSVSQAAPELVARVRAVDAEMPVGRRPGRRQRRAGRRGGRVRRRCHRGQRAGPLRAGRVRPGRGRAPAAGAEHRTGRRRAQPPLLTMPPRRRR